MDTGKFIGLLVFFLVGALVLMAFVPVIQETTSATDTFTNDGYYRMGEFSTTTTIEWSVDAPTTLEINETAYDVVELLPVKDMYFTFFANDGAYMRVAINSLDHMILQCQNNTGTALLAMDSSSSAYSKVLITIDEDSVDLELTPTVGDVGTKTEAYSEWCYVFDPNGYYMMKDRNTDAYVTDENIIILAGVTDVATSPVTPVGVYGHGTIDDLVIESAYPDDDTVYSNIVIDSETVTQYIGLNKVGDITFDMTRDETTTIATYSYYLVPYEVTVEKTIHPDTTLATVINLLPLIAGVGLLMFLVAEFLYTRYL